MPVYRTQFERFNFGFDPALKQVSDVVFECDAPNDEEHYHEVHDAAWEAMWKQNACWENYEAPLLGYSGWSSVMGGYKIEEVLDIELDFNLGVAGEGFPRIAETFTRKHKEHDRNDTYRVTGFYKTFVPSEPVTPEGTFTRKLLDKILAEEREKMTEEERARADKKMKVIQCAREEAEFIGGSGVAGCITRVEDVVITGRVNWEERDIARARRDYKIFDDMPISIYKYWEK